MLRPPELLRLFVLLVALASVPLAQRSPTPSAPRPAPNDVDARFVALGRQGPAPLAVQFFDLSTGGVTAWQWNFGDGARSTIQHPRHVYTAAGTYSVLLFVRGPAGFDRSLELDYVVASPAAPQADFTALPTYGVAPLNVSFDDRSTGAITSWSWDFGDGSGSSAAEPNHVYTTAGLYTVTLTTTGPNGSSQRTRTDLIRVNTPPPGAAFEAFPRSGTSPLTVQFADASTGHATAWVWNFGDGTLSTERNPVHTFVGTGSYYVALTAIGPGGSDGLIVPGYITVEGTQAPNAGFDVEEVGRVAPIDAHFTDTSSGVVTSWSWDFGDGVTSATRHPSHRYIEPGTYSVTLTVAGPGGADTTAGYELEVKSPAFHYGMNASVNSWSSPAVVFADAMARGLEFGILDGITPTFEPAPTIPRGHAPPMLGEGWPDFAALEPGRKPMSRLFGDVQGRIPDGSVEPYVVVWSGTGSCSLIGSLVVSETNRGPNRVAVFVDPALGGTDGQLALVIDASHSADPVRDVHVWLPGMEAEKPLFWPPFLEKVRAMNNGTGPHTWRTLDWNQIRYYGATGINGAFVFDLDGRITPRSPSQGTRRGVCPEFQVAFCNELGANLHFSVPHKTNQMSGADYEIYVRDVLTRIRDGSPAVPGINGNRPFEGLAEGLTVTLEYSNELWNPGFVVNSWLQSLATANGRTLEQQIAIEITRVFQIADEVFSGPDASRLRTFVGGWIADPSFLADILAALPAGLHVDAVGPATYFRPNPADVSGWLVGASGSTCPRCPTAQEVILAARANMTTLVAPLQAHRAIADAHLNPDGSSPLLSVYEAGQSFIAGFQPWAGAASAAQSLPEMYDAYVLDLIPLLENAGVDLVNWYSFMASNQPQGGGANGPFGHWDNMSQSITLPVPATYLDEGVPKAAAIYRGPPARD